MSIENIYQKWPKILIPMNYNQVKKNPENAQKLNPENKWGEKNSMTNVEKINQKQTKNSAIENKPNVTQK